MKKFYLTTPIYYVNDRPHIGHAYTTVAADVLARWYRLTGHDVFFLTGTDEHGAKIMQAAEKSGQTPQAFCDTVSGCFKEAWNALNIAPTAFIRTTDEKHVRAVQQFLALLHESGAIYKGSYKGLYCVQCEKFLSPGDLDENQCCPDHKQKPSEYSEENYFFRLSAYRDRLLEILTNEADPQYVAVHPVERRNEIIGKLKLGLDDISISRASLAWGIPLPFDEKQTAYVWVDALLNYITALGYADNAEQFKAYWPADLHLMAKDILWFHSVIWPALLLAAGLPLPKRLFSHGFFTIEGNKMSKSLGNVIRPEELIAKFGVDASRYLLLALFPFGSDGDISWQSLTEKYNTDLANNLGNLVSRTLTMIEKYCAGSIPAPESPRAMPALSVMPELSQVPACFASCDFSALMTHLQKAIDMANRHIEASAPWKMAKEKNPALPGVLYDLAASIGSIAPYLYPFMPEMSGKIWAAIGETTPIEPSASAILAGSGAYTPKPGTVIKKPGILFPRITT